MSLYRYVAAKDELLALMVDAALRRAVGAAETARTGAPGSRAGPGAYHAAFRRHPWVLRDPDQRPRRSRRTRSPGWRTACARRRHRPRGGREALGDAAAQRLRPQRGDAPGRPRRGRGRPGRRSCRPGAGQLTAADRPRRFPALHAALAVGGVRPATTTPTTSSCSASSGFSTGSTPSSGAAKAKVQGRHVPPKTPSTSFRPRSCTISRSAARSAISTSGSSGTC